MSILISGNRLKGTYGKDLSFLSYEKACEVRRFHESFPMYEKTPLVELKSLAQQLGVSDVFCKDESYRFGLNAFKVLGGSYAIGSYIKDKLGLSDDEFDYECLRSEETHKRLGEVTFISATDGNHGRGIAWTAKQIRQHSVIYMPAGSAKERLENICAEGADAQITEYNYDDAVRLAASDAQKNGWILVQDTSWPGYEELPIRIMQGYTTLSLEIYEQLGGVVPTHIFLQAGVGSFATSAAVFFRSVFGSEPIITVVEPNNASCVYNTISSADGKIHPVKGEMKTIMAGLACGEPVTVGIEYLTDTVDFVMSVPDYIAADGMRVMSSPCGSDKRIISGESGAVGIGTLFNVVTKEALQSVKEMLNIDRNSKVLCVSTEGSTDIENYRQIVWNGACTENDEKGRD